MRHWDTLELDHRHRLRVIGLVCLLAVLITTIGALCLVRTWRATIPLSNQHTCEANLMHIEDAERAWVRDNGIPRGRLYETNGVRRYLSGANMPWCPTVGRDVYDLGSVGELPKCRFHGSAIDIRARHEVRGPWGVIGGRGVAPDWGQ